MVFGWFGGMTTTSSKTAKSVANVVAVVASLRQDHSPSSRDLAIAIHNYVRDIPFGFTRQHDAASVDYTLRRQVGHCTPKAQLFTSLLQEAGFEATMVTVPIPGDVLHYLGANDSSPYPRRLQHTFTEVTVEDKLCRVDSYVVDPVLFVAAKTRLQNSDRSAGYGIHSEGSNEWDGRSDSFCQYVPSTHTPEYETKVLCSKDIVLLPGYLQSDLMSILSTPLLGYGIGYVLENQNRAIGDLRK